MLLPEEIIDLSKLCIHTQTNRPWNLRQCVDNYHRAGIRGISIWRHLLEECPAEEARLMLDDHGLDMVSLVRGGFFPSVDARRRKRAIDDNLLAIEQAATLKAPLLVLVCGSDPQQSQEDSRKQIRDGILKILPDAQQAGVKLAIEPLHPMYAADRSAITTICQANDMAQEINSDHLGIAVDVFHLWWDASLQREIMRSGSMNKLFAFHVCDWNVPLNDMLNDRGLMGDGCINLKEIRGWMEAAGFKGYREVEVFSDKYWATDQVKYLKKIKSAYLNHT